MPPRNRPPDHLPDTVRDHPAVIAACQQRDLGRLFRTINNLTEEPERFTATHIGILCQMPTTRIQDYMRGKHAAPSLDTVTRVADGLHIPGHRLGLAPRPWEHTTPGAKPPLPPADTPIGQNIRSLRRARGKTQEVIAQLAGIEPHHYGRIERGTRTPSITVLHSIARALETSPSALLSPSQPASDGARHPHASADAPPAPPAQATATPAELRRAAPTEPLTSAPTSTSTPAPGIGELIRTRRHARGLSQDDLADALNETLPGSTITRTDISRYESETRMPTTDRIIEALSTALDTPEPELRAATRRSWAERRLHLYGTQPRAWQRQDPAHQPNDLIRQHRHARGWTQHEAAEAIAAAVQRPNGIDAQYIARLERGQIRWPNADYRAAIRTVYGAATDTELGLTGMRTRTDSPHQPHDTANSSADDLRPLPVNSLEDVLIAAAEEAADFGAWAEQMHGGAVVIERLHQRTRQLASASLTQPPATVMTHARGLSRDVFALAREHHKPAQARDLYVIATYLCSMMAWLAGDLGALDAAELQARTAWACAEIADDTESTAWALSVRAKIACQRKDYRSAVELTRRGLRYESVGTGRLMLTCQEADALSLLGATGEAIESIRRAETEAERNHGADSVGGLLSCGPARHANYAAGVHLLAGQADLALSQTDRALGELTASDDYGFGTIAQVHITRTAAHIQAGQIDGAAEAARPVLDLPPERRLATLTTRLQSLTSVLDCPALRSSTLAEPLRTEITEYCGAASPAGNQLTSSNTEDDRWQK